jgi:hypothetical protein
MKSARNSPTPNAFLWVVDITEETRPMPIANFMIPYEGESKPGSRFGAINQRNKSTTIFTTSRGLPAACAP